MKTFFPFLWTESHGVLDEAAWAPASSLGAPSALGNHVRHKVIYQQGELFGELVVLQTE